MAFRFRLSFAVSEAKADDHDDRADHDGREELVQPLDAEDLDEEGDEAIDEANHRHADGEDPEVHLAGRLIVDRDRRAHGAHVGEARREEHRGFEFRDEEVEEGADARGEEGRGDHDGGEIDALPAKDDAVLPEDDHRDGDAGDEHREHVLNRENDRLRFLLRHLVDFDEHPVLMNRGFRRGLRNGVGFCFHCSGPPWAKK